MSARAAQALALLFVAACTGCIGEVGAQGGGVVGLGVPTHPAVGTHVGVGVSMPRRAGPYGGVEIDGTSRGNAGTSWSTGLRVGWGLAPDQRPWSVGYQLTADVGGVVDGARYARYGAGFAGVTLTVPIWIGAAHEGSELNNAFFFLGRGLELAPFLRVRWHHHDLERDGSRGDGLELAAGIALRLRLTTDLL